MQKKLSRTSAFTMIELLVAATIIIVLTTLALVSFNQANISVRNGKRKADLDTMRQALLLYKQDNGYYAVGSSVSFPALVSVLYGAEYLSEATLQDPKNSGSYVYQASCTSVNAGNCVKVTLQAILEPSATTYEIIAL
jgi:type II secretory pathway pseudopilin PulG